MVPAGTIESLVDQSETLMRQVIAEAEAAADPRFTDSDLPVYDLIRYHLGWVDETFRPVDADRGKRVRPAICLLTAGAAGADPARAVPIAAAIELLHNFTLMHDDVQDASQLRRGRPTVWRNWGEAQAINAGDATFALSQLALLRAFRHGTVTNAALDLIAEFNRMTLQIVEGQVLDLGFADRWDIDSGDYLRMIAGKTAAIVAFAASAGARLASDDSERSRQYQEFGRLLGLGFQVRDDYLGIWGQSAETGKAPGDDIRGRKKSIPIVMLLERLSPAQAERLRTMYESGEPEADDVAEVIELLDEYRIAERVQQLTTSYHDDALELLERIAEPSAYRDELQRLAERLVERTG